MYTKHRKAWSVPHIIHMPPLFAPHHSMKIEKSEMFSSLFQLPIVREEGFIIQQLMTEAHIGFERENFKVHNYVSTVLCHQVYICVWVHLSCNYIILYGYHIRIIITFVQISKRAHQLLQDKVQDQDQLYQLESVREGMEIHALSVFYNIPSFLTNSVV